MKDAVLSVLRQLRTGRQLLPVGILVLQPDAADVSADFYLIKSAADIMENVFRLPAAVDDRKSGTVVADLRVAARMQRVREDVPAPEMYDDVSGLDIGPRILFRRGFRAWVSVIAVSGEIVRRFFVLLPGEGRPRAEGSRDRPGLPVGKHKLDVLRFLLKHAFAALVPAYERPV